MYPWPSGQLLCRVTSTPMESRAELPGCSQAGNAFCKAQWPDLHRQNGGNSPPEMAPHVSGATGAQGSESSGNWGSGAALDVTLGCGFSPPSAKALLGDTIYAAKIPMSRVFIHSRQLQLGQFCS